MDKMYYMIFNKYDYKTSIRLTMKPSYGYNFCEHINSAIRQLKNKKRSETGLNSGFAPFC